MPKTTIDKAMSAIRRAVDENIEDDKIFERVAIQRVIKGQQNILTEYFRSIQDVMFDLECQIKILEKQNRNNGCCNDQMDEDRILQEIEQELSDENGYRHSR